MGPFTRCGTPTTIGIMPGAMKQAASLRGVTITAPASEAANIGHIDTPVAHGDIVRLGNQTAQVIDVGGHTLGHIAYWFEEAGAAFVGDALFALGCGRMFEGTPQQFHASLSRLKALPPQTVVYCAHEYTAANAAFALSVDPDNDALKAYADTVTAKRGARGEPIRAHDHRRRARSEPVSALE
jgi:hydroxyacylglutathione hydrolase